MYTPEAFAVSDPAKLHDFIERHSFGLLVSQVDGMPFATHLPFLLDREHGPHGILIGHMARANPQWRDIVGQHTLAVFAGPHAYISPTWYEAENTVPTWNYTAVHVYGTVELVEDRDGLLEIVERSVNHYESSLPKPWVLDAKPTFVDRLLQQVVGFRIRIDRLEGKWKLNQNHPVERREKVIRALQGQGSEDSRDVASMMKATIPGREL